MSTVADIAVWLEAVAPLALSEPWDNTGLLLGDPQSEVRRLQTCLTLTPASVSEAIARRANMVVAHHPLPFKPLAQLTTQTLSGRLLWQLAGAGVSVYCPHTAWDSAPRGINALLAEKLSLAECRPLCPTDGPLGPQLGAGRVGELPQPRELESLASELRGLLPDSRPRGVDCGRLISRVAIACGSGGSLLSAAVEQDCDLFLTGEASFHSCLEAQAEQVSLLLLGHFASERFAMEFLAEQLQRELPQIEVWASERESDPVRSFTSLT
ncbi:MAG: Nif3-like dinuclear metal center hexameric protein [Planctomycetales bacterium]|nr:Nif3-like dinuclear metal center hexameric protein [Planctomycetales bacterium]